MSRCRLLRGSLWRSLLSRSGTRRSSSKLVHQCSSEPLEMSVECGDRRQKLSTGRLARMADGSALVSDGDTAVLVTVVAGQDVAALDGTPLTVEYRQKAAAAGRIPTNFLRRELGSTEAEVLTSRMIDRSLRARFPTSLARSVHVACNVLSIDGHHLPDVLCVNAAAAALICSPVPWHGPVAAARVGWLQDQGAVVNPTRQQLARSSLNLLVTAAPHDTVVMLEASAEQVSQQCVCEALQCGITALKPMLAALDQLREQRGVDKLQHAQAPQDDNSEELYETVNALCEAQLVEVLTSGLHNKQARDTAIQQINRRVCEHLVSECQHCPRTVNAAFQRLFRRVFRTLVLQRGVRCDGRACDELRVLSCDTGLYGPLHGSAVFQRGQTQVMATVTFDSPESALKSDLVSAVLHGAKQKNFMVNYEFPAFATNELGRAAAPNRREIGHGALAERALRAVVPSDCPFTIRLSAEVLESNGSSSMATVCAGSLALLDAGVKLDSAVAGVAVGMVSEQQSTRHGDDDKQQDNACFNYRLLTDILGMEDQLGDMDFKAACTRRGVTALQVDFKLPGVPLAVVDAALTQARSACHRILDTMNARLAEPRTHSQHWPVLEQLSVPAHKRARLAGPGGVNLRRMAAEVGVQLTPREDGQYSVFAPNCQAMNEARERIDQLLADTADDVQLQFGAVYSARVMEVRASGVMVQLHDALPPALLQNSQLSERPVAHPSALDLHVGDQLHVKYFGRDPVSGRMRLSRKAITQRPSSVVKNLHSPASVTASAEKAR